MIISRVARRYKKLSSKLITSITIAVIICFGIFTYSVTKSLTEAEFQRFEQTTNILSQQIKHEADLLVSRIDDAASYYEEALTTATTVQGERDGIYEGLHYYNQFTKSIFLIKSPASNQIVEYYKEGEDGKLKILIPDFDREALLTRYNHIPSGDTQFFHYDKDTGKLFAIKKIHQASTGVEILLGIELNTAFINQIIEENNSDLLGNVGITTKDGYIFSHTDESLIGQSLTDLSMDSDFKNTLIEAIANNKRLKFSLNNSISNVEVVTSDDFTFMYIPIPIESYNSSWGIIVDIKDQILKESSIKIAKTILTGGILTLLTLAFVIKFIVRLSLKPIDAIMTVMKEVESGNLDARTSISSYNEMEIIGSQLNNLLDHMIEDRASIVKQKNEIEELFVEVENLMQENDRIYFETIKSLAKTIDAKDQYTGGHCERVTDFSLYIGKKMGLSQEELSSLTYAAMLHDIGKIGVPEWIITKEGKLTDEEYALMKTHPEKGYEILKDIHFLKDARLGVLQHHEKYNGTGYPNGLSEREIDFKARIIAIADAFDAMTSDRSYRKALPAENALQQLIDNKGIQFDPVMVDILIHGIKEGHVHV